MTSKRQISTPNETGVLGAVVKPVVYARLDFSSGIQRFHTEIGPKTAVHPTFGSESYTGIGDFGGLSSEIKEATSGAPANLTLTLTGVDASLVNNALVDDYFRRDAEIMLGLEDGDGVPLDDPEILFSGYMDKLDIVLSQGFGQMTLNLESRGTNLLAPSDHRFTDEDKQAEVTGDLMGEYIYRMADLQLRWGTWAAWGTGVFGNEDRRRNRNRTSAPSDRRLKKNVQLIGTHKGINIYSWQWNTLARCLGINAPTVGVIAQEHQHTDHVVRGRSGFLGVDYAGLFL